MKTNRKELLKALKVIRPGLGDEKQLTQSDCFIFAGGEVLTYNDEICIRSSVDGLDLTGAIKGDELYKFVDKVQEEEIEIEQEENKITFSVRKIKAEFTLQEVTLGFPEKKKYKWEDFHEDLLDAMEFAAPVCSIDMSMLSLTCVHLRAEGIVEGTDRFRIFRQELPENLPIKKDILIPARKIGAIVQLSPNQINIAEGWVNFKNKDGVIIQCRLQEIGDYPELDQHFIEAGTEITFPSKILESLERARIFTDSENQFSEFVTIELEKKKIKIIAKGEVGKYEEEGVIKYSGSEVSFDITPILFEYILKKTHSFILGEKKVNFIGDSWQYMAILRN